MANAELRLSLQTFVDFAHSLKGDEKSEAQLFLDHLFRALGHGGVPEAGATFEFRIAKKPSSAQLELIKGESEIKSKGGKKFADLLWPDRVLIEMKSRGESLEKHYDQAFNYWTHIVPKRPPFVILCNFDEFWIYDFNEQLFDPVDRLSLRELPGNPNTLAFLFPAPMRPVFGNNKVQVTRRAANQMAHVFRGLLARGIPRERAQRFILQLLVALVSEDLGLLPDVIVTRALDDALEDPTKSYDLFNGLFGQMNNPRAADAGRWKDVQYFNGGLFGQIDPVELRQPELYALRDAADYQWDQVKPEIFGTIFQASMDKEERHAFGAHFTSEFDIQKVVGPTIVGWWRERIIAASTLAELRSLLAGLRRFRVLDPACGSGNFLYVAYREMKRLERELLVRLRDKGEKADRFVSDIRLSQFFGIDVVPFAVELARVTLMLAKELELAEVKKTQEADGLLVFEKPLPLDNLDKQIVCADALFTDWPLADAIIGNPPYLDARKLALEHGDAYVKKVRAAFPNVPGRADFCVYWFRKAQDQLRDGGRAGLVGTNTVRQNYSREGGLDYIVAGGGTITNAVSTQVWSGDAQVHVSIVNWVKGELVGDKVLTLQRGDNVDSPWERYTLERINSALSPGADVSTAIRLQANARSTGCFEGQQPGHDGFRVDADDAWRLIKEGCGPVIFPYLNGDEMLGLGYRKSPRFIIDFGKRDAFAAREYGAALQRIRERVLPEWEADAAKERERTGKSTGEHQNRLRAWWQLKRRRQAMIDAIEKLPRYTVCVRHTKRPIFEFLASRIHPDSSFTVFPFPDDYSFGVLQSAVHFDWFMARCSTLKADFRYTSDTVFDTFPWPQSPSSEEVAEVARAAVAVRNIRCEVMCKLNYSLRELYRTLEEPGDNRLRDANAGLDKAVRAAYKMGAKADSLTFLLNLNTALASKEKAGDRITPPGFPLAMAEQEAFITADCVSFEPPGGRHIPPEPSGSKGPVV